MVEKFVKYVMRHKNMCTIQIKVLKHVLKEISARTLCFGMQKTLYVQYFQVTTVTTYFFFCLTELNFSVNAKTQTETPVQVFGEPTFIVTKNGIPFIHLQRARPLYLKPCPRQKLLKMWIKQKLIILLDDDEQQISKLIRNNS